MVRGLLVTAWLRNCDGAIARRRGKTVSVGRFITWAKQVRVQTRNIRYSLQDGATEMIKKPPSAFPSHPSTPPQ